MKSSKFLARKRRALKAKYVIRQTSMPRLVVFRSINHIYCQVVQPTLKGDVVIAQASTVDKDIRSSLDGSKVEQAKTVGKLIAERTLGQKVSSIAFDRNGFKYHGRVKALADAAREAGLIF
ncbi:MAG: 50S ribosomal protein L18 [Chitinophagia bacterium]|nr:50S ribosomal protein L18 [Chitinophagia bacterium]